jgi:uncharacterized membrane protein
MSFGPAELVIVLLLAGIIAAPLAALVLVARWAARPTQPAGPDPRAVLAHRLARGEISRAEFDTAMRALGFVD